MKIYLLVIFLLINTYYYTNRKIYNKQKQIINKIYILHADSIINNDFNGTLYISGKVHCKYKDLDIFCKKIIFSKNKKSINIIGKIIMYYKNNTKILANKIEYQKTLNPKIKISGQVFVNHGNIKLLANNIYFYPKSNNIKSSNNILIFRKNYFLTSKLMTYNVLTKNIHYKNGKIYYDNNIIIGKEGNLYKNKIELLNIKISKYNHSFFAKKMIFNYALKKIKFLNCFIKSNNNNNFIMSKYIIYYFKDKIFEFSEKTEIKYKKKYIICNGLIFNKKKQHIKFNSFLLKDLKQKYILVGNNGDLKLNVKSLILKQTKLLLNNGKICIHSYITKLLQKTNGNFYVDNFYIKFIFFSKKEKMYGLCNNLSFNTSESVVKAKGNVLFWNNIFKISGDVMSLYIKKDKENNFILKSININNNAYVLDMTNFNKISDNVINGTLEKNILQNVIFKHYVNRHIIFSLKNNIGIHKFYCDTLKVRVINNNINSMDFAKKYKSDIFLLSTNGYNNEKNKLPTPYLVIYKKKY